MDHTLHFTLAEQKVSVIQITSYANKNFEGFFENVYYQERKPFANLTQMLTLIDHLQDDIAFPQRSMEPRSFKEEPPASPPQPLASLPAATILATFHLRLLFRQNASWQGTVTWVEQRQEVHFRSALELVFLMDSILS